MLIWSCEYSKITHKIQTINNIIKTKKIFYTYNRNIYLDAPREGAKNK